MNGSFDLQSIHPDLRALIWFAIFVAASLLIRLLTSKTLLRLVRHTKNDLDDRIVAGIRGPVGITVILIGAIYAANQSSLPDNLALISGRFIKTLLIAIWALTTLRIGNMVIVQMGTSQDPYSFFKPRIQPIMLMLLKMLVVGATTYFIFKAWNADISGWLASAGIIGIAVGFAAKDTLANLFSGVFIMADAPYQIGDYIVLDGQERGRVTHIGLRSTRLLTREDVEIIVPNAVISNSKIINESGGPYEKFRVRIEVSVAYGSDIDKVRTHLMRIAESTEEVEKDPFPRVRFRRLGDSGLDFNLLVWVAKPEMRGSMVDVLLSAIYKDFQASQIEIPYPKRDVYLHHVDDNET